MAVPGGAEVITPALAAPLLAAILETESCGIAVTHDRALAMAKRAFVPRLVCRQQPLRRATTSLSQHFHLQGCHLRFKSCSTIATNVTIKSGTRKGGAARSRHSSKDADGTRRRRSRQRLYNHRPARTPRCRDAEETRRWHVSTTTAPPPRAAAPAGKNHGVPGARGGVPALKSADDCHFNINRS